MKTKRLITRWLALALCLATTLTASAYDFIVDGLAYNILPYKIGDDEKKDAVEVTFKNDSGAAYDNLEQINIQPYVIYNGKSYLVTGIGESAFKECRQLESVILRFGSIFGAQYYSCDKTFIKKNAFLNCTNLREITFNLPATGSIDNSSFDGVDKQNCIVRVPEGAFYRYDPLLPGFTNIYESCVDFMNDGLAYRINQSNNTAIVTHQQSYKASSLEYWEDLDVGEFLYLRTAYKQIKDTINIPETVEFEGETYIVTEIDDWAFGQCKNIKEVHIPRSINKIGRGVFSYCDGLCAIYSEITAPENVCSNATFGVLAHAMGFLEPWPDNLDDEEYVFNHSVLFVPHGTEPLYWNSTGWSYFSLIFGNGDVNGDGRVDINDVNAVVNLILGRSTLYRDRADITGDGKVGVADLNAIVNVMLGRTNY